MRRSWSLTAVPLPGFEGSRPLVRDEVRARHLERDFPCTPGTSLRGSAGAPRATDGPTRSRRRDRSFPSSDGRELQRQLTQPFAPRATRCPPRVRAADDVDELRHAGDVRDVRPRTGCAPRDRDAPELSHGPSTAPSPRPRRTASRRARSRSAMTPSRGGALLLVLDHTSGSSCSSSREARDLLVVRRLVRRPRRRDLLLVDQDVVVAELRRGEQRLLAERAPRRGPSPRRTDSPSRCRTSRTEEPVVDPA
jgi:hypothetical protein